ncbi:hypothetical protein [Clostridium sp.]|jgi:hypothetical protein|uniref:hypothetical protein n=1 Tax=Clostridium sp. TaxID=1506 RepID=UPI0025829556|nr:hypothetical protein [Clostridium sp.]MDF2502991.1 hypothetical protein [Clostridium sp.]
MERRSRFITFLVSLVPGAGYMYLGMLKKGFETLLLFILVPMILSYVNMSDIAAAFCIPFWLYTFFNTYHIARKVDSGEILQDESWFAKGGFGLGANNIMNNNSFKIIAWFLIIVGVLAIANKIFMEFPIFDVVRSYFVPVIFIIIGLYLLLRDKKKLN